MQEMTEFKDKVVLITGATGGIGRAAAYRFAREQAILALVDLDEYRLEELRMQISKDCGVPEANILIIAADVSRESEVARYVEETVTAFGRIDCFFNNAGVCELVPITEVTEELMDKVWGVNVKGVAFGLKHVIPHMEAQGGGTIVCTGSVDSFNTDPFYSLYSSSKHAVMAIAKCAALEVAGKGIRINVVCPGPIDTNMMATIAEDVDPGHPETTYDRFKTTVPLGRLGQPEEIAEAVAFLLSPRSSYMTATRLVADGGFKHM